MRKTKSHQQQTKNSLLISSRILHKVYHSIDDHRDNDDEQEEVEKFTSMYDNSTINNISRQSKNFIMLQEKEQVSKFEQACLREKWMEKKINEMIAARRRHVSLNLSNNSNATFPSASGSSSFQGVFLESGLFSGSISPSNLSSDAAAGQKALRKKEKLDTKPFRSHSSSDDCRLNSTSTTTERKVKSFVGSFFTAKSAKKNEKNARPNGLMREVVIGKTPVSPMQSSSSSPASYPSLVRSCLCKNSPTAPSSSESLRNGVKKMVTFCSDVSIILDQSFRPLGQVGSPISQGAKLSKNGNFDEVCGEGDHQRDGDRERDSGSDSVEFDNVALIR